MVPVSLRGWRTRECRLVTPRKQQGAAIAFLYFVQLPDHAHQAGVDLAKLVLIDVRIPDEVKQAAAAMWPPVVMSGLAVTGIGMVITEAVAILGGHRLMRDDLVEHTDHH